MIVILAIIGNFFSSCQMTLIAQLHAIVKHSHHQKKAIAQCILRTGTGISEISLKDLADSANVSLSSINRFVKYFGFTKWGDFTEAIYDAFRVQATTDEWLNNVHSKTLDQLLCDLMQKERSSMEQLQQLIHLHAYEQLQQSLLCAKKVYVLGQNASSPMARSFAYELGKVRHDIILVDTFSEQTVHLANSASKDDLAVIFSFPRYPGAMLRITELIATRQATIALIGHTENPREPFNRYCDICLTLRLPYYGFTTGYAAIMSLISCIVLDFCKRNHTTIQAISDFEDALRITHTFISRNSQKN